MTTTPLLKSPQGPMLLHPRYIMRVAGEPAQLLRDTETGATAALLAQQQQLRSTLAAQSSALCAVLERAIHGCTERELARTALNVKRAVFNLRPSKADAVQALQGLLGEQACRELLAFNALLQELSGMDARIRQAYVQEMEDTSARMATLWAQPRLQDAISYSNPELYAEFQQLAQPQAKPMSAKSRRKLEDTLVQYLARCSSKTSPLSTFTVLHVGRWAEDGQASGWELDYGPALERRVQVKGALMRQLLAPLVGDWQHARQLFALCMNPSTVMHEGRLRFRTITQGNTASGKFWGTGEAVAEINVNAVIACMHHVFVERGFESIREADLITAMCKLAPKLQADSVRPLLAKLYELRLLLPDTQQLEQTDPLQWAAQLIDKLPGELGQSARARLALIQQALTDFCQADPAGRARGVGQVREHVAALRELLGADDKAAVAHPVFFENVYLHDLKGALGPAQLEPLGEELALLLALSPVVSFAQQARCDMADYFLSQHGEQGVCTDALGFIERFDTIYGLGSMSQLPDTKAMAPASGVSKAYSRARKLFNEMLTPLLHQGQDVQLDLDALRGIVDALPEAVRLRGSSQSYLGQVAMQDGAPLFVLNQVFGGRSALMSRFMEVLDTQDLKEVREYLLNSSENALFAELPGVFGFNANHHPRMADHELVIPPYASNWEETHKFEIDKLRLVYDVQEHMVRFQTEDGRDLDLWYQGFLMPMLLPRIQRVLALAYTEGINNFTVGPMMAKGKVPADSVSYVPRVSLGRVVLARRTWIVPIGLQLDAELAAEEFFVALQAWRGQHGLPSEVFVRVVPVPTSDAEMAEQRHMKWDEFDFKDLKPFYVKFDSPRLVRLMQRTMKRNRFALVITEALPALDDQHVKLAGRGHVAELQFELSTLPPRLAQPQTQSRWQVLRVAYHDEDRRALVLGPVQDLVDRLHQAGLPRVMVQPHWKHGPHLDVAVFCSERELAQTVWPAARATVQPWLQAHPSRTVLDPVAYERLSQRVAITELESGPYLPLLLNNSISESHYEPPRALKLPEFARAREDLMVAALPLSLTLLREKAADSDGVMLTLAAMLTLAGDTFEAGGFAAGYVSFRSHAEYFFAAYDSAGTLRPRFDALDTRLQTRLDAVVRDSLAGRFDVLPLTAPLQAVVRDWQALVQSTAAANRRIVDKHYQVLLADQTFERLVQEVGRHTPEALRQSMGERKVSELSVQFARPEGVALLNSPHFMAYRTTVNFFYALLPLIGVSPQQKFCLCHLVALSAERVLGVNWRDIMGMTGATAQNTEVKA
jgi:Lantibiotic dehydratase, N terminus/Lantibiotic biosynthesis dehydratase C-term